MIRRYLRDCREGVRIVATRQFWRDFGRALHRLVDDMAEGLERYRTRR